MKTLNMILCLASMLVAMVSITMSINTRCSLENIVNSRIAAREKQIVSEYEPGLNALRVGQGLKEIKIENFNDLAKGLSEAVYAPFKETLKNE